MKTHLVDQFASHCHFRYVVPLMKSTCQLKPYQLLTCQLSDHFASVPLQLNGSLHKQNKEFSDIIQLILSVSESDGIACEVEATCTYIAACTL